MRQLLTVSMLTEVFVGARLSTFTIADALEEAYGRGEYVAPEGPLNIMRGHSCVNNGMIAKQRKYAAPMRLGYSFTGDAGTGDCTYTRNVLEDDVRELPVSRDAMAYLSEHYKILKSMFTIENDVVVVDRSPQAPFHSLFKNEHDKCVVLFAALLVLAGGGDIRLNPGSKDCTDEGGQAASLIVYDPVKFQHGHVLDLESVDSATLEVVKFFAKYGGAKARRVADCGLHYADSPSFLIQAYICEFVDDKEDAIRIFEAAKEIVAKLPAGASGAQRFFTTDRDYARAYSAGYNALYDADLAFDRARRTLLSHWNNFRHDNYSDGDDSKHVVSTLLKLCYCLYSGSAFNHWDARRLDNSDNGLLCALRDFTFHAFVASDFFRFTHSFPEDHWELARNSYAGFLAQAEARAPASQTIMDCCAGDISAGLTTDPKNFLVVLAWIVGEPEEELRSLQQLLNEALDGTNSASCCQQIGDRVAQMLNRIAYPTVKAQFGVCTAPDGARHGSLWLSFNTKCTRERCDYVYVLKLAFKPERVEIRYVSQQTALSYRLRGALASALKGLGVPRHPALSVSAHEELDKRNNFPLCALMRKSIMRCLYPDAHRAVSDVYIAQLAAAKSPLARHAAISRWMAHQPMQSLDEAVKAGIQLLPVFKDLLARSSDSRDPMRRVLTVDDPVVAVLDNILGSAAAVDHALRLFVVDCLRRCASERTDLFPSVFLPADASPCSAQEWDESARDCFTACLVKYDIPEMLLRHAERSARGEVLAAGAVHGQWSSAVCAAVARCFELRYEKRIRSLGGDASDVCYYRYSICALIAAAADPAEYHAMLRSICSRWNDTLGVFKVYMFLQMALPRLPRPGPISPALIANVFPGALKARQIKSLLRVFAVFALTEDDYCGVCRVFYEYRALLRPVHACEFVELLKSRHDACRDTLRALSIHPKVHVPAFDMRTPPYSELKDLLVDCLGEANDADVLMERAQDLLKQ
ncbi:hypothetical protein PAPHI01_0672 [Pancytospora philotis]|nr:hypothetical protein PAPHI01_0672 [Pancytospora philotis]